VAAQSAELRGNHAAPSLARRGVDSAAAKCHRRGLLHARRKPPLADSLILEVADFEVNVLTGIYSEETGKPQPLRITIQAALKPIDRYTPETPLGASKNYMDLKFAASEALPPNVHFKLIEAVADHICETLFLQDARVAAVTVKIVKLAISEAGEKIGMTLTRDRR
jgi:dihydroneopterin aldolase